MRRFRISIWSLAAAVVAAPVLGQTFPAKPIRIITSGVGSSNDFNSRLIAQGISGPLGQQVLVENRGSGVIPTEVVAKSPPDGYTLLMVGSGLWITPLVQKTSYDAMRDFSPVSLTNRASPILVVHPSVPVKTVKELIALAKAHPGELNYSSGGTGTGSHLAAELFKNMAGVNIVRVHYKVDAQEKADLLAGHVQTTFGFGNSVMPHIKSGKLRALGVGSAQRSPLLPAVPTIASSGLPGFEAAANWGLFAPANTPLTVVNRLSQEIVRFLSTADAKERFLNAGIEPVGSSPEEYVAFMKSDLAKWAKLIKDAGIHGD